MKTIEVKVGDIGIGGNNPVRVQSMTNTNTADIEATTKQIIELYKAGSELVRFTVKDEEDAKAVPQIKTKLLENNCNVPIIGDFHYNGHLLLTKFPECAKALDKYRINPGNVGFGEHHDENFKTFIDLAIKYNKPVRIGINFGSIDQRIVTELKKKYSDTKSFEEIQMDALIISAIESCKKAVEYGLRENQIIISIKISSVQKLIEVHERLATMTEYPLHLGLTEAGIGDKGMISTTAALSVLLNKGIGDTIRVSITPKPNEPRTKEVHIAKLILQANGIRNFLPEVISCPGCGRTSSNTFQKLANDVNIFLEQKMIEWQGKYSGVENMKVAVMGCIVNGPGESKDANLGISLPGNGENLAIPLYVDGVQKGILAKESVFEDFTCEIVEYVKLKYGEK